MEHLFKVKYWDYSDWPLNYHGHICLFISLFWGFFSVLLVKVIHVPVENLLLPLPSFLCEVVAFLLVALFGYDFRTSLSEAMNLRDVIIHLTENNETIKRMENRLNAVIAFSPLQS